MTRRLLLLSNSRDPEGRFLHYAAGAIREMLGAGERRALFIPFASVRNSWEAFELLAAQAFKSMGYSLSSIHRADDPVRAIVDADAIVVGGGNTFHLLKVMQERVLLEPLRQAVAGGTPYIGWSAGAVLACPTIMTTNDMPIVAPRSFDALGLVPFQINAHYTDVHPPGFQGETRAERLEEFVTVNPSRQVIGLPEGTLLRVRHTEMTLLGDHPARLFAHGAEARTLLPGSALAELLRS